MDWGVHVAEGPLVGRDLPVGMHIPLAQHQRELLLCEVRVHERERNTVKRQIPSCIPRIFPFVGHGDNVSVVQVGPLMVAALPAFLRWGRIAWVAFQPVFDYVVIELLRPQHAGKALTHDVLCIR